MALFCCVVAHSRNTVRIIHPAPLPVIWGRTWNNLRWRSVYCNPSRSLPLLPLFFLAGSMPWTVTEWSQPSLVFSVRSKKRQVSFLFKLHWFFLYSTVCSSFNRVLGYGVPLLQFSWDEVTLLFVVHERNSINYICCKKQWSSRCKIQSFSILFYFF